MVHAARCTALAKVRTAHPLRHFRSMSYQVLSWFHCRAGIVQRHLSRSLCLVLILSLLSTSTPAAPRLLVAMTSEQSQNLAFWFYEIGS